MSLKLDFDIMRQQYDKVLKDSDNFCEFRCIKNDSKPIRHITRVFDDNTMSILDKAQNDNYNIYYGIFDRDKNFNPISTSMLWVDIDFKDIKSTNSVLSVKTQVTLSLCLSGLTPSMVVSSGHGIHAYWELSERLYDKELASSMLKRLAKKFNGDKCYDIPRILRAPGSWNVKDEPVFVEYLVKPMQLTYNVDNLNSLIGEVDDSLSVDSDIQHIIETGDISSFPDRSLSDYIVVKALIKNGYDFEDIVDIFENNPIGENKYGTKKAEGRGEEYLRYTYSGAVRAINSTT